MRHDVERGRFYIATEYGDAIIAAGGIPVHLSLSKDENYLSGIAARLDGVLLPGSGSDVDPVHYDHDPEVKLGEVHPLRDGTDLMLLSHVEERGLPLLAICYGMQVWNVARGGTLLQDVTSGLQGAIKHQQEGTREHRSHRVKLADESRLGDLVAARQIAVNSHHHQGVAEIGENLRPVAWANDGLVEGVEETRAGRWGIGVQWHPEVDWNNDEASREVFASFINAAQAYRHAVRSELASVR